MLRYLCYFIVLLSSVALRPFGASGEVCYILTDVPVDSCKLVPAQFSVASPLELTSVGTAAPLRRGQMTFSL